MSATTIDRPGSRRRRGVLLVGAALAVLTLAGWLVWSGMVRDAVTDAATAPATTGVDAVLVDDDAFGPVAVAVPVGTTVTWTWAGEEHDVVLDDGRRSPVMADGSWSVAFDTPGTVAYHCSLHPRMHGRVDVAG